MIYMHFKKPKKTYPSVLNWHVQLILALFCSMPTDYLDRLVDNGNNEAGPPNIRQGVRPKPRVLVWQRGAPGYPAKVSLSWPRDFKTLVLEASMSG